MELLDLSQKIHGTVSCYDVAKKYMKIVKDDGTYASTCPFCGGYRSLWLSDEFFCENCLISGDVVSFYMLMTGKTFKESVKSLSKLKSPKEST